MLFSLVGLKGSYWDEQTRPVPFVKPKQIQNCGVIQTLIYLTTYPVLNRHVVRHHLKICMLTYSFF